MPVTNPVIVSDATISTTDITTNNATMLKHGFLPKLSGVAGQFLNGVGSWTSAGLTYWTESETLYFGKYYTRLLATSAQTNADAIISPKGTGGFSLQKADGTVTSGNARGLYSVDLSLQRTAASQVASGDYSINGSYSGTASGNQSVNFGYSGIASGQASVNFGFMGLSSQVSAINLAERGTSSGISSVNLGYGGIASGTTAVNTGYEGYAFCFGECTHSSGKFTTVGDAQRRELILRANTTSATPVNLTADQGVIGTLNQLILQNNQSVTAQVLVVAKKSGTTASTAHFRLTVCASRGTSAATTVLHINPVVETLWNPDNASIAVTADTANGGITFTVTTPTGNWHTVADIFAISTIYA